MKHELNALSKIKLKTTILCENLPQLMIQIVYSTQIGTVSPATYFAFVFSFISIILAISTTIANEINFKKSVIVSYYVKLSTSERLGEEQKKLLKKYKAH